LEPRAMADQEGRPGRDFREESLPVEKHFHKGGPKLRQTARDLNLGRAPTKKQKNLFDGGTRQSFNMHTCEEDDPRYKNCKTFCGRGGKEARRHKREGYPPRKKKQTQIRILQVLCTARLNRRFPRFVWQEVAVE